MKKAIRRYMDGWVNVRAEGASSERFLNLCRFHEIALWDICPCEEGCTLKMKASDFKRLKPFVKKTGTRIRIMDRGGFPFFLHKYRKRTLLFAGAVLAGVCLQVLSLFIWDIQIVGNETRTDEMILKHLDEKEIHGGMKVSDVDCAGIATDLRRTFKEIIWVSASLDGTRLIVRVKEAPLIDADENELEAPMDLVAQKSGKIASIVTRQGVPKVQEGSEFKQGDVLVSGNVEVKNDAGEVIGYQYQVSDAEIWAYTETEYEDQIPAKHPVYETTGKRRGGCWIGWKGGRIVLGSLTNSFSESLSYAREWHFTLGEGFQLPFYVGYGSIKEVKIREEKWTKEEYQKRLTEKFEDYCQNLEKKGVQILQNNVRIYKGNAVVTAKGTLSLLEPIGKQQRAEKKSAAVREEDGQQEGN